MRNNFGSKRWLHLTHSALPYFRTTNQSLFEKTSGKSKKTKSKIVDEMHFEFLSLKRIGFGRICSTSFDFYFESKIAQENFRSFSIFFINSFRYKLTFQYSQNRFSYRFGFPKKSKNGSDYGSCFRRRFGSFLSKNSRFSHSFRFESSTR